MLGARTIFSLLLIVFSCGFLICIKLSIFLISLLFGIAILSITILITILYHISEKRPLRFFFYYQFPILLLLLAALCYSGFYIQINPVFSLEDAKRKGIEMQCRNKMEIILRAIFIYERENPGLPCPSPSVLARGNYIEKGSIVDPWNNKFKVLFSGDMIILQSFGPDGIEEFPGGDDKFLLYNKKNSNKYFGK